MKTSQRTSSDESRDCCWHNLVFQQKHFGEKVLKLFFFKSKFELTYLKFKASVSVLFDRILCLYKCFDGYERFSWVLEFGQVFKNKKKQQQNIVNSSKIFLKFYHWYFELCKVLFEKQIKKFFSRYQNFE